MSLPATLLLIDGSAVIYRAFYAISGLSTRAGEPTNALYGSIRMLGQLRKRWRPTHWLVVLDGGLPAERTELLLEYKANRPSMPDDLRRQMVPIERYLSLAAIPAARLDGEEADDVLATVARRAERELDSVLLATSDKDLFQLVGGKTKIVPLAKPDTLMGVEEIAAKTGVVPARIVEWLALVGDSSDNIPGVPGVGVKTAAKLLNEFGSLAQLFERLSEVKPDRIRNALMEHRETVRRNVDLVRLNTDLPYTPAWPDLEVREVQGSALRPFFEEMEFGSMVKEQGEN